MESSSMSYSDIRNKENLSEQSSDTDSMYTNSSSFASAIDDDFDILSASNSASLNTNPKATGHSLKTDGVTSRHQSTSAPQSYATNITDSQQNLDLMYSVRGMYRILDLISEQGSGGLVDKVIIDQNCLRKLINTVSPGAYLSLTKVNFKVLDQLAVKPIGVYGSKEAIVSLFSRIGAINPGVAHALLAAKDDSSGPRLRSGLYLVRDLSGRAISEENIYAVYWPEDTTWDDDAVSSVRRNRVTFMRYLTKIADQVISLISSDHASSMVWNEESAAEEQDFDLEEDQTDRLFAFEVAKTNEQEEDVKARPGFKVSCSAIELGVAPENIEIDEAILTPRLLAGETVQAFMTARYLPPSVKENRHDSDSMNGTRLRDFLKKGTVKLGERLSTEAIETLIEHGLNLQFPKPCSDWKNRYKERKRENDSLLSKDRAKMKESLENASSCVKHTLHRTIINRIMDSFPTLNREKLNPAPSIENDEEIQDHFADLLALYPWLGEVFEREMKDYDNLSSKTSFRLLKERLIMTSTMLAEAKELKQEDRAEMIRLVLEFGDMKSASQLLEDPSRVSKWGIPWSKFKSFFTSSPLVSREVVSQAKEINQLTTDVDFISGLDDRLLKEPLLQAAVGKALDGAYHIFNPFVDNAVRNLLRRVEKEQENESKAELDRKAKAREEHSRRELLHQLIHDIEKEREGRLDSTPSSTVFINRLETVSLYYGQKIEYRLSASETSPTKSGVEYKIHHLAFTQSDIHNMQMQATFIPTPHIQDRNNHTFCLPVGHSVLRAQSLNNDRLLLIIQDPHENLYIYLERPSDIDDAFSRNHYRKVLHRDKIGRYCVVAYDEGKRMLSICSQSQMQLYIFVFDETFKSLQSWGNAIELAPWYPEGTTITHSCFVCGHEEILLVDNNLHARIFSLITQQFLPATLHLEQMPKAAYSSPDGSCLFLSYPSESGLYLRVYHWSTFGSTEGILLDCPLNSTDPLLVTSLVNRSNVHLVGLDIAHRRCNSVALDISKRITQFMFQEKGSKRPVANTSGTTVHNCLIDCHAEVWTRFPVVPAVKRQIIVSSTGRLSKQLLFVTDRDHKRFAARFAELVNSFEQSTRKPTGDELRRMDVRAMDFNTFISNCNSEGGWDVSRFLLGEWLVDILCLIPIHIAVTRENRFIPLKDGVTSAEWEKSLLGAEVGRIVDHISLGWYESIFQSYMVSKPVKVVSSMGEQSVGKSFALNHLVDTSFAGSAMRTTEGVWLSVTPTEDCLVVALDFEGVHSIERSAQEDTLLVLFNTAISNMVLFRNNFALSRNITGLFQSFQSSSTVLDPAANPSLFQSRLIIIIKDVVDSDKAEIVREFSLKFQKIVQDEQDSNFISKLHSGKLDIIPWPVIESRQFYTLFPAVKKRLDQQPITHHAAGEFLYTLKTLMAKLKANDWGALSQTLAAHRAQQLSSMLKNALCTGCSDIDEPLKNIDSDSLIDMPDSGLRLFLSTAGADVSAREIMLNDIQRTWDRFILRNDQNEEDWISGLTSYLNDVVELRINYVHEWMTSNLSRFKTDHANIENLRRAFDAEIVDLKANVQLCRMQCVLCHLFCIRPRGHEDGEPHDCHTDHTCGKLCDFVDDHPGGAEICGSRAGHAGKHICAVDVHLCGQECKLRDKRGCLEECTRMVGHEGDHLCSARIHACGEPCELRNVILDRTKTFTCRGTCSISSDEAHDQHVCDNRMCPITCQLCKRLCASDDHLHGLDAGAVHLCGQGHSCNALCAAPGICEIDTAPQSIEATFTGRHQTFQYTKYSQVAKRLPCKKPISPGELMHKGAHNHSTDQAPFHFCEARCDSCGYFCTLPLGHTQQEHETRHGSMSKTRWSIDGPDGTVLELNGRKFGADDDGAPMMCSLYCSEMGRHVHLDYCRHVDPATPCQSADLEHISARLQPNPDRPKDWVSHGLYWRRTGFKDPYSREEQAKFGKCDAMCPDPEHTANAAQPSFCTLPMFHPPHGSNQVTGLGYVSNDGHLFSCKNPAVMQQAFHVIFVIDKSGSMYATDRLPLPNAAGTNLISCHNNNRLGAVYSSLHAFWISRQAALNANGQRGVAVARRDAYSLLLFNEAVTTCLTNDFTQSPDELLNSIVQYPAGGGTNFTAALSSTQALMEQNWSTERTPIVIFLSDGECNVTDETVRTFCRSAVTRGKPLSLQTVAFGPNSGSLRRMAQIGLEVQRSAPRDPLAPASAIVDSSYSEALDSIKLAETFLGIAEALRKPRGSLMH